METEQQWFTEAKELLRVGLSNREAELLPNQVTVLKFLLERVNTLYIDRTGAGKSATYFLATALLRRRNSNAGPTIVVAPLLALVNDQIEKARSFQLRAETINSTISPTKRGAIFKAIRNNMVDILYVTAEMLTGGSLSENIPQMKLNYEADEEDRWTELAMLVIDEVHCVSEWGHDFRPAYYSGMRQFLKAPWAVGIMKLGASATVPKRVENDLRKIFNGWVVVRGTLYRKNITIRVIPQAKDRTATSIWLKRWFEKEGNKTKNVLIFSQRIDDVIFFATFLRRMGLSASPYHSNLTVEEKQLVETTFKDGSTKVVVSTIALGMGFDKGDIHTVIHTYTPSSPIQYYQEIGRAGRNLDSAEAIIHQSSVWRSDTQQDVALTRLLSTLKKKGAVDESSLLGLIAFQNVKKNHATAALTLAVGKGYIEEIQPGLFRWKRDPTCEESQEQKAYSNARGEELKFMNQLVSLNPSENFCVWQRLLSFLGEDIAATCGTCVRCQPRAGDVRMPQLEVCYRSRTPKHGIPVYGFQLNHKDNVGIDLDLLKKVLLNQQVELAADPPAWKMTYVPGRNNRQEGETVAEELGLEYFDYISVRLGTGSMTQSHTQEVREKVLANKFTFNLKEAPPGNVIIYDDAMKSGMTLDTVCKPLLYQKRQVIAIVPVMWVADKEPERLEF